MIVQFATLEGENKGPQIDVPLGSTVLQMEELMNQLLENKNKVQKGFWVTHRSRVVHTNDVRRQRCFLAGTKRPIALHN